MVGAPTRRGLLALAATSGLAGCSSVLSTAGGEDPDCGMLGDPSDHPELPESWGYMVDVEPVTEPPADAQNEPAYQEVPEGSTAVAYACLEGRDVEYLLDAIREEIGDDDLLPTTVSVTKSEAERVLGLLNGDVEPGPPPFVAYEGTVVSVSVGYYE